MNPKDMVEYMDAVIKLLDPQEQKKREDERKRENEHRVKEGLSCI